jgi:hypothetical protein
MLKGMLIGLALPFAKPEAAQQLRTQLLAKRSLQINGAAASPYTSNTPAAASWRWLPHVVLTEGVVLLGYFIFHKET